MTAPKPDWTVIIYIAAPDENLKGPAFQLLFGQLPKIGSSEQVHVVVQLDSVGSPTRRFFVNVKGQEPVLIPDLSISGNVNMGSVAAFIDLVNFVKKNHEANHYLVVLNGHGHGVEDFPGNES